MPCGVAFLPRRLVADCLGWLASSGKRMFALLAQKVIRRGPQTVMDEERQAKRIGVLTWGYDV